MRNGLHVDEYGNRRWFVNGKKHRTDGPAVECPNRTQEWWLNGKRHRTDWPAFEEVDGYREWWLNGKRHRTDGPAIEHPDGYRSWCLHGVFYTFREWLAVNTNLTPKQKIMLMIKYGDE